MSNYKVIIFDFDGTLCETRPAILYATQQMLQKIHADKLDIKYINSIISLAQPLKEYLLTLIPKLAKDQQLLQQYIDTFRQIYDNDVEIIKNTVPYAGVIEWLPKLQQNGIKMFIVSGKHELAVKKSLQYLKLDNYFEVVIGSRPDVIAKPDPMIFQQLIYPRVKDIAKLDEMLMIGDTIIDISFAKNSGIKSCFVEYGHGDLDNNYKPDYIIGKFKDLDSIVCKPSKC